MPAAAALKLIGMATPLSVIRSSLATVVAVVANWVSPLMDTVVVPPAVRL